MRFRNPLPLLGLCFFLAACAPGESASGTKDASTYFPLDLGEREIRVQFALNDEERARGLMFREALAEDHGMLFVFPRPAPRSFWMKNTGLPLDIGYFDDRGRLLEVHPLYPYDESGVPSRSRSVQFALEMNRGWFEENGVAPGAVLDMAQIADGIRRRGIDPERYGF